MIQKYLIYFGLALLLVDTPVRGATTTWDTFSDTWGAADALGRTQPHYEQVGPPRQDRTIGMFYFLWLGPHAVGGPHDIAKILARDPDAMSKKDSPLWGPLHAAHHWGESLFGYYNSDDPYVLRKHAQMLSDASVDVIIFDVTNQATYRSNYFALLRSFKAVRDNGGKTPQIAFLTPFWEPAKVVSELYKDLYEPGHYPESWFRWDGKPLILADPDKLGATWTFNEHDLAVRLEPDHTLGQTFTADTSFVAVGGNFPTWRNTGVGVTLVLKKEGPSGQTIASRRFDNVADNAWLTLRLDSAQPGGKYYLEARDPMGVIGWWSHSKDKVAKGEAIADARAVAGDRCLQLFTLDDRVERIRQFFTFRAPQPDYFQGQNKPDMWSWLEVYPQHVFTNKSGQKEQMSVGVAQNAAKGRLGSMSEPGSHGRSFHAGRTDAAPNAVLHGLNLEEQFNRALKEDPQFLFITGWNEWIAGRFDEFNSIRLPVMFVDQYDQEHSRDIEPMKGGHGDNYYYQALSYIRRYKGVRPAPVAVPGKTIRINSEVRGWDDVKTEYRDDIGDVPERDWPAYNSFTRYKQDGNGNDFKLMKVARDNQHVFFYAQTSKPITDAAGAHSLMLLIDADCNPATGWEGFDFIVNRQKSGKGKTIIEKNVAGWNWQPVAEIEYYQVENRLHLAVPIELLGMNASKPCRLNFKWADNVLVTGKIIDFLIQGDTAPNARFYYRYREAGCAGD